MVMTQRQIDMILDWSEKDEKLEFMEFVNQIWEAYNNKKKIKIKNGKKLIDEGKLRTLYIYYNTRFPDMDIDIGTDGNYLKEGGYLCFSKIMRDDIKKIGNSHFCIRNKEQVFYIIIEEII